MGRGKPRRPKVDPALRPGSHGQRRPRVAAPPCDGDNAVVWQLRHLDDFPKEWITADWPRVVTRLQYLEQQGWRRIGADSKKKDTDHFIKLNLLHSNAQQRLVKLQLDDEDHLLSIHVHGGVRAWAVRVGTTPIARLLWWDPDKEVYPTSKRHT